MKSKKTFLASSVFGRSSLNCHEDQKLFPGIRCHSHQVHDYLCSEQNLTVRLMAWLKPFHNCNSTSNLLIVFIQGLDTFDWAEKTIYLQVIQEGNSKRSFFFQQFFCISWWFDSTNCRSSFLLHPCHHTVTEITKTKKRELKSGFPHHSRCWQEGYDITNGLQNRFVKKQDWEAGFTI